MEELFFPAIECTWGEWDWTGKNTHSRTISTGTKYFRGGISYLKVKKNHKSPGIDQIPAELIKAGSSIIRREIYKLIISIWNKERMPEEWKESIIVPIYKKGDKTDCNNYRGISLLPTTYKILSNILLSRLSSNTEEIIGDHQWGIRRSR